MHHAGGATIPRTNRGLFVVRQAHTEHVSQSGAAPIAERPHAPKATLGVLIDRSSLSL